MHPLPEGRLLLAFSGGPDSLGLAAALRGRDVLLAYLDHRLRGTRASRHERAAVRAAARALGLPLLRARLAPATASEASARAARHGALRAMARRHGCAAVLTAHTADDRAETILLRLLRGTGLRGLAALPPRARVAGLPLCRPAVGERRDALRARGAGLPAVEDRTNRSTAYARARVRGLLLPALREHLGADPVPGLCALGDLAAAVRASLERCARGGDPAAAPAPLFPYLVEARRRAAGAAGAPYSAAVYEALRAFLAGRGEGAFRAARGETWVRGRGGVALTPGPCPASRPPSRGAGGTPPRPRP